MEDHRSSGILLAVSSLPAPTASAPWADPPAVRGFLAEAGQHYWQILPLVPPGDGSSPYMSPSAFAGNPYLIDLDELAAEGLLTPQELDGARWPGPGPGGLRPSGPDPYPPAAEGLGTLPNRPPPV